MQEYQQSLREKYQIVSEELVNLEAFFTKKQTAAVSTATITTGVMGTEEKFYDIESPTTVITDKKELQKGPSISSIVVDSSLSINTLHSVTALEEQAEEQISLVPVNVNDAAKNLSISFTQNFTQPDSYQEIENQEKEALLLAKKEAQALKKSLIGKRFKSLKSK